MIRRTPARTPAWQPERQLHNASGKLRIPQPPPASLGAGVIRALPPSQDLPHLLADTLASGRTIQTARQECVVIRMLVTDGGGDGREQGTLFQIAAGFASAYAPAASRGG